MNRVSRSLTFRSFALAICSVSFLLLMLISLAGDVESNPGPSWFSGKDHSCNVTAAEIKEFVYHKDDRKSILFEGWNGIPSALWDLIELQYIEFQFCRLVELPTDIERLLNLIQLHIINCSLRTLPQSLELLSNLKVLVLSRNQLSDLPHDLANLRNLQTLNLKGNCLEHVPACVFKLAQLKHLYLSLNQITVIPPDIKLLQKLEEIRLHKNPITHLPVELTELPHLKDVNVWSCPLVHPPVPLCKQGTPVILEYLRDIKRSSSYTVSRQKIVIYGKTGGGKTSLTRTLCCGESNLTGPGEETKVLEQTTWCPKKDIMLQMNDFGGHDVYSTTQPFFVTPNVIPLHVFNLVQYVIGQKESFDNLIGSWLRNMYSRQPGIKSTLVGTHSDLLNESQISRIREDVQSRLIEMDNLRVEEIKNRIENIEEVQNSNEKSYLQEWVDEKVKGLLDELRHTMNSSDMFMVSSKTLADIQLLSKHIIQIAETKLVHLPKDWHKFILEVTCSKHKRGNKAFLAWCQVESIFTSNFKSSFCHLFKSKQKQMELNHEKMISILTYMRDAGEILFYNSPALSKAIFHDTNILIKIMKAVFVHDLRLQLQYQNFSKEFSEPVFEQVLDDISNSGVFEVKLLYGLWRKQGIQEDCFEILVELMKAFDLCYEVSAKPSKRLLFPWFLPNSKPDKVDGSWSYKHKHQLTLEFHFWPNVPVNFFEMSMVLLHRHIDATESRRYEWKSGVFIEHGSVRYLLEKFKCDSTLDRAILRLAIRGGELRQLWKCLLPVYLLLKRKLHDEWPGVNYDLIQLCPHCVRAGINSPHFFPGQLLEKTVKVDRVPCKNSSGDGKIDALLVCPPRDLQLASQAGNISDVPYRLTQRQPAECSRLPQYYAVLVAGTDRKAPLLFYRDVFYLKKVLTDSRIMGIRPENMIVVSEQCTETDRELSADNVMGALTEMKETINSKVREDAYAGVDNDYCFLLYYSGHSKGGELDITEDETVMDTRIYKVLDQMFVDKKLVIFDCCSSDGAICLSAELDNNLPDVTEYRLGSSILDKTPSQLLQWCSSGFSKSSYFETNKLSFFTEFIIKGLCSAQAVCALGAAADCESCGKFLASGRLNGCIQLFPLIEYVYDHVIERAANENRKQETVTKGKFSKDLSIARFNTEQLFYLVDVKYKDAVYSVMLNCIPEDMELLKCDVMDQIRTLYICTIASDEVLTFFDDGKELSNIGEIQQVSGKVEKIIAELK